ncbi:MAG: hypothetical protein DWQ04_06050 [Chloroflexi bacterium]|nr:MAG: hypothetical protein DWQ04_06050 [Chloroflexota bacterium]
MEAAGISTVIIAVKSFHERFAGLKAPRVLLTPFLLGQPLGPAHQPETQKAVLQAAIDLLASAKTGNTLVNFEA